MIGLNKIGLNQVQLNRLYLNAPFPTYRKMAGGGGSGDGFPQLPGDVTRWHFGGLTNEMMAAMDDPRIEDADGKGRFLSFKNFLWAGMSGVGGYEFNFLSSDWFIPNNQTIEIFSHKIVIINKQHSAQLQNTSRLKSIKITIKVTGLEANGSTLRISDNISNDKKQDYNKDGIYKIDYTANEGANIIFFYAFGGNTGTLDTPITIEQLPLYPGFILGDGVDDFAVTEKELNFEDTYTVYTAFIPFQDDPARNMMFAGKDIKDFYINYSSLRALSFYSGNKAVSINLSNGFNLLCCKRNAENMTIKNLITGNSVTATANDLIDNPGLYYLWRVTNGYTYSKAAIAGQIIDNGHFTTDEEDEKVLNWHKKQYPWLFPDQAWTVVGKTNEDTDRATIGNITGNGNNLVLSNFGFTENSGYGLYYQYFGNGFKTTNGEIIGGSWNKINNYNISCNIRMPINSIGKCFWDSSVLTTGIKLRFKLTGIAEGDVLAFRYTNVYDLTYTSDGIYIIELPPTDKSCGFSLQSSLTENLPTTLVTIELLPFEYEGYLVTDGVDDKIQSSNFPMGKDFTIVGEWRLISVSSYNYAGIVKSNNLYVYNNASTGLNIYVCSSTTSNYIHGVKSLKAIRSDGRVYDENWTEYKLEKVGYNIGANSTLDIGTNKNNFTKIAFKNLEIYNNKILSKEDCIKAYNYLQTLKAK